MVELYTSCVMQAAVRGTNYYEEYTGIELPLKKLDFMAIPGLGGAVENWGLLQFDERRMLVNEVNHAMQISSQSMNVLLAAQQATYILPVMLAVPVMPAMCPLIPCCAC